MARTKKTAGRPRKLKNRDIAMHRDTEQLYAIVGHRIAYRTKSQYRCVPLNNQQQKYGRAVWILGADLEPTGRVSRVQVITTYYANEMLDREMDGEGGRGCDCQCCIHTSLPYKGFTYIGRMVEDE